VGNVGKSILKGHAWRDQVHLLISLPPQVTISRLLRWFHLIVIRLTAAPIAPD
jgi:REP element-mobilizing transposase RayT